MHWWGAFEDVGLPFFGGCQHCSAQIAPYNACPTKNGLLTCLDCIREDDGFETVEEANLAIFPNEYEWKGVKPADTLAVPSYEGYDSQDYYEYEPSEEPDIACDDE